MTASIIDRPVFTPSSTADTTATLERFLNAYWLRPENAFWMTLRSRLLATIPFDTPSIDVSCGDGLFSFLHAGGALGSEFDVFASTGGLERVTGENADMFDVRDECYSPRIVQTPAWRISDGADLKLALLAKAGALDFYERLHRHDNNEPLPFEDAEFATVYCNSAYWVRAIVPFLRELARVTRDDGRIVLHVKLSAMHAFNLAAFRRQLGSRFLELIDRGRAACWPTLATRGEWESRFETAGLEIESATPLATRTHAQVWDVGLRPIAPLLVRMANSLRPDTRAAIKRDWVALLMELALPLCDPGLSLLPAAEPAEMQYVLRPRRAR